MKGRMNGISWGQKATRANYKDMMEKDKPIQEPLSNF